MRISPLLTVSTDLLTGELSLCGHRVKVWDCDPSRLDLLSDQISYDRNLLAETGLLTTPPLGQVNIFTRLEEALLAAQIVIEAVTEDLAVKTELVAAVCEEVESSTVLVSSTLRLSPEKIFQSVPGPGRTLALRFLFPVYSVPEVEVRPWRETDKETLAFITSWLERMGKTGFLRSGPDPLILSCEERDARWEKRADQLRRRRGLSGQTATHVPSLAHPGNLALPLPDERISVEQECIICMDQERDCLLCPCHHLATCQACGDLLLQRKDSCPICRKNIDTIIKVFRS